MSVPKSKSSVSLTRRAHRKSNAGDRHRTKGAGGGTERLRAKTDMKPKGAKKRVVAKRKG